MKFLEILLIGVGLAMDAFAVSVCKGLSMKKVSYKKSVIIAIYFGVFQALMPAIGYALGHSFQGLILAIDHWIIFFLLSIIGIKMIAEAFENNSNSFDEKTDIKTMIVLGLATSIDALAVGLTFAFLNVNMFLSVSTIGIITFVVCFIGVLIGGIFGDKFGNKAEILGGLILILIGTKILIEHLINLD